jgi:hypothetical protein
MCVMFLLFSRVQKKEGGGGANSEKKSVYKSGWDMSHMAQLPRNLLRERDLRLRHVAIGAGRNMAHMARKARYLLQWVRGCVFHWCEFSADFGA